VIPQDIFLVDYQATCAAGINLDAIGAALAERRSGLSPNAIPHSDLPTWVGAVKAVDDYHWSAEETRWQSRNNALIDIGLQQGSLLASLERLKQQFGSARIGVVMGSSTSSIDRTETAYRELDSEGRLPTEYLQEEVFNPHAPGLFLAHRLGVDGPNITVNTACSSSAKVFATGARWLRSGLVDAVLVGGADSLCLSVLHGFNALQLVSTQPCRPFDGERDGINLGEAAGFALLVRGGETDHLPIRLSGYGESSDAHHMSHPHPEGEGARLAIEQALQRAGLAPADIGYINLHGTASRANDHIEGNLVGRLFGPETLASSTKGWTGHTLGAAGILEALFALHALDTGLIPGTLNLRTPDPDIDLKVLADNCQRDLRHVMSNSFGFGGNNACLIFSKVSDGE
jgi:3-oxoacyl-[acyl-carrier-protein] synthase-1